MPPHRAALLDWLRAHSDLLASYGVGRMSLFGSFARDEATDSSDVDLLVEFQGRPTFRRYMGLKLSLEQALGRPVDLVTVGALRPEVRAAISAELLDVA